jgi:Predicted flavin-nucleotide-binding protein
LNFINNYVRLYLDKILPPGNAYYIPLGLRRSIIGVFYFVIGGRKMFREMRRKKQKLSKERSIEILKKRTSGVLSVIGDDEYPYTIPMSYVYSNNKIYFHSALKGHKIDAIKRNNKVSFCVIDKDEIISQEFTTYFRSVIVFGKIEIIDSETIKREAINKIVDKYSSLESQESKDNEITKEWKALCLLQLNIEHISGKEAIELVRLNKENI